eukprot:PhM_4_TR18464/c1_g1_i1/m.77181
MAKAPASSSARPAHDTSRNFVKSPPRSPETSPTTATTRNNFGGSIQHRRKNTNAHPRDFGGHFVAYDDMPNPSNNGAGVTLARDVQIFVGGMRYDTDPTRAAQIASHLSGVRVPLENVVVFLRDPERPALTVRGDPSKAATLRYSGSAIFHLPSGAPSDRVLQHSKRVLVEDRGVSVLPDSEAATQYVRARGSGPHPMVIEIARRTSAQLRSDAPKKKDSPSKGAELGAKQTTTTTPMQQMTMPQQQGNQMQSQQQQQYFPFGYPAPMMMTPGYGMTMMMPQQQQQQQQAALPYMYPTMMSGAMCYPTQQQQQQMMMMAQQQVPYATPMMAQQQHHVPPQQSMVPTSSVAMMGPTAYSTANQMSYPFGFQQM